MKAAKPEDGKGRHGNKRGMREGSEKVGRSGSVGPSGSKSDWSEGI